MKKIRAKKFSIAIGLVGTFILSTLFYIQDARQKNLFRVSHQEATILIVHNNSPHMPTATQNKNPNIHILRRDAKLFFQDNTTQQVVNESQLSRKKLIAIKQNHDTKKPPGTISGAKLTNENFHVNMRNDAAKNTSDINCTMISVDFTGRLGNLMFIFATLKGLAVANNMCAIIEPVDLTHIFNLMNIKMVKKGQRHAIIKKWKTFVPAGGKAAVFDPKATKLSKEHTMLYGYLQSWKYFESIKPLIKKDFTFKNHILEKSRQIIHDLLNDSNKTKVGIHIRRGDMEIEHFNNFGYTLPGKEYFQKAINFFRKKYKSVDFIAVGNGMRWFKENVKDGDIKYPPSNPAEVDMAILTLCDHTIMSVGTFSWWSAYLAGGDVIYYKSYPRPNSSLANETNKADFFHPSWIGIA